MQNKNFRFYILIFFFSFMSFNAFTEEQFTFDVSQIEILENGNVIKGLNRGTVSSNNGITVEADTFIYNKQSNILDASGSVKINHLEKGYALLADNISFLKRENLIKTNGKSKFIDSTSKIITAEKFTYNISENFFKIQNNVKVIDNINNYILSATNVSYSKNNEKIITEGKSNLKINSRFIIDSKDLIFDNKYKQINSQKKTTIKDNINKTYYELSNFTLSFKDEILKGENILVKTDFNLAQSDNFFFKSGVFDLKNQTFLTKNIAINLKKNIFGNENNDPRLKGVSSSKKDGITTINKGIFTSCKKNTDCTPWSIQAEKIEYDQNKKQITYDNALLKIYERPVFYFPKFFHPGPTVKRQSGFLAPQIGNSKILGSSIQIPYFKALSENKDLTFTPSFYTEDIIKFQNEYRQENERSSFIVDAGYVKDYKSKTSKDKNSIIHLFSKYRSNLNFENFINSSLDVSIQKVSNDNYLKVFDKNVMSKDLKPDNLDVLTSEIKMDLSHESYDFNAGFISYENLQKSNSDRHEFILPYYNLSKNLLLNNELGLFNLTSLGDNTLKDTNNLRSRIINDFDFKSYDLISKLGLKNNMNFRFKNLITSGKNDSDYNSSIGNDLMGILEVQSSLPMTKIGDNYINYLEPKISLRVNPSNMTNYSDKDRKIDNNNIFDIDRLGLTDTLETGKNLTLGFNFKKENINDYSKYIELKLGTIIRDKDNNAIPTSSAISKKNSNLFGSLTNNLNNNLKLDYQFSVNDDLNKFEYNDVGLTYSKNIFKTEFNFIEENGVIGGTNVIENETSIIIDENKSFIFETRQNRKLDLTEYYNLIYQYKNDCLTASVKYNKSYYTDRDLRPEENLMFTITLIPITSVNQTLN